MTIACESADVRAVFLTDGSAGMVAVLRGNGRLAFRPWAGAPAGERRPASSPSAIRGEGGPAEGVISRRAFPGSRQACRDARAVQ